MKSAPEPRFTRIAAMIGDPTRGRMLAALLDGAMLTAGEIAQSADVTPQTASAHLAKLLDAELVVLRVQGRHRYFRLADGDVAHALEALSVVADKDVDRQPGRRAWSRDAMKPLRHARTCYGHLAGHLGVCLHDALMEREVLVQTGDCYEMADAGRPWLEAVGFDATRVTATSRGVVYPCVDWSERRDHFAGPLAVALLDHFVANHWLTRIGDSRALAVSPKARRFFDDLLVKHAPHA